MERMTLKASAFCPGHISGYFKRVIGESPATTGSAGAGIVISEGVLARVSPAERTAISVFRRQGEGKPACIASDSPLLRSAMEKISITATVTTECRLPPGAGFGLSAAALLATLTALNHLYDLGMDERSIAHIAHETEIRYRTGLGDVTACRGGGMVVRRIAGIDAEVQRYLEYPGPVSAVSFGPIHTPSVLGSAEQMGRVASAFPAGVPGTMEEFFSLSREFAEKSGLVTLRVSEVLAACDASGVNASMTMLGNGVFAYGEKSVSVLAAFGDVYRMGIATNGPVLVEETS